ncbi:MAG: hypothetical protein K1W24_02190 [Lachnospiraceae bacterium]
MGMDLDFWKYKEGASHNDGKVYELACCDGKVLEELENLPSDSILEDIAYAFKGWDAIDRYNYESKNTSGSFQVFTTGQIARFDCYGMENKDINLIIDIMHKYGCPLYDPQVPQRFDTWTAQ